MKFVSTIAALGMAVFLAGCDPQEAQILVNKWNIPDIPPEMYNCPIVQTYPAVKTLTDSQVAKLLIQLRSNNITCKNSLEAIRLFLADARNTIR